MSTRASISQRRIWNSVVLGSALLLVLFAAFVVLAVFGSAKQHDRLSEHMAWGHALHLELASLQRAQDPDTSDRLVLLSTTIEAGSDSSEVRAAARSLRTAAEASGSSQVAMARASAELDHALDQRAASLTGTLNRRGNALQAISISSVAMAMALVGLLLILRRRILAAEAIGVRLESALDQVRAVRDVEKAANHAKAEFLATVSHEIRTPLTAILGSAELLDAQALSQAQAERVGVIRAGGETLLNLIDAVLDLSKIESSAVELHPRPYSPMALLEETLLLFAQSASDKGLELSMWASPELPTQLQGDPDRTRQVAVNLMGNAIKFTQKGEVHLRAEWTADGLCIEVHDTGPGIDAKDHERIMESFTQLEGSRHADYGGVGLGLTISLRILRAMGGFLELESSVGQGSTFSAHMPHTPLEPPTCFPIPSPIVVAGRSASAGRVAEQLQSWGATTKVVRSLDGVDLMDTAALFVEPELVDASLIPPMIHCVALQSLDDEEQPLCDSTLAVPIRPRSLWRSLTQDDEPSIPEPQAPVLVRVLVVDDHSGNRKVIRDMLESLGATVRLASGAKEALELLPELKVHLVLMDIDMPMMTGLEATKRLRARGFESAIIGLSGHATSAARSAAIEAGMDDYVTKPVRLAKLRQVLDQIAPI